MKKCHCCGDNEVSWQVGLDKKKQLWCYTCGHAMIIALKRGEERRKEIDLPSSWYPRWMKKL